MNTHWVDGRIVDGDSLRPGGGAWSRVLAVLVLLLCIDLTLGLVPAEVVTGDPNPSTSAEIRRSLGRASTGADAGSRALVLVGDSVLAGDVMRREHADWRSQRVVDHMRAELSLEGDAVIEQVALDGLLPIDALHVLAELDRVDPLANVELVLELNLRYFSSQYAEQDDCTRSELCELGAVVLAGAGPDRPIADRLGAGPLLRAAIGLAEAAGLVQDYLVERTPIHRRRAQLERVELDAIDGLVVARETDEEAAAGEAEGLARVQEHYRSSAIEPEHAQVLATLALLDRLHATGRRASLFLTPIEDEFARAALAGNRLGHRYGLIAKLVHDHAASKTGCVRIIDLDHPLFESSRFIDHVHLDPEGNRLLALNLLHELGLPMATRPRGPTMVHDEDHDRTLIHRRGVGYADGSAWQGLMRDPRGVAVSRDGSWIVIADTGNHALRQLRGSMQIVERLAGKPMVAGLADGVAIGTAQDSEDIATLTSPHSPEILGERVYFLDGKTSNRVRELADGYVRRVQWEGPTCSRYDVLEAGVLREREWLYLLCRDDRILALDLAARRSVLMLDPRAPVLADEKHGATRIYKTIEPTNDGRLLFADGDSRIWSMTLRGDGRARRPVRVFENDGPSLLPNEYGQMYPFGFDEMRVHEIVGMEWVDRYGALLIQDEHPLGEVNKRLFKEETERVHVRLLDFETQQILPWVKAIPHGEAFHMWNGKSENLVSYFHFGSMAIAQDDASLVWVERTRSRAFRIADGLLGVEKSGNLHTARPKVHLLQPVGTQSSSYVGSEFRPDRFMGTRHEPIPHRGPYVALLVGSSLSTISDRLGNYSLGRRLELELQAELGYRDNVRLDLFQRTDSAAAFEEFLAGEGPAVDVLLLELTDLDGLDGLEKLDALTRLASQHGTLVIFYDNSAMASRGRDGMRAAPASLRELIAKIEDRGFTVLQPTDRLLRELMNESPWGNHPWGEAHHHGAPWSIDLTARVLASMSYPLIREHLRGADK